MKYLGILLIVLGAIALVVSYFTGTLVDFNWFNVGSFLLMVLGLVAHILLNKHAKA